MHTCRSRRRRRRWQRRWRVNCSVSLSARFAVVAPLLHVAVLLQSISRVGGTTHSRLRQRLAKHNTYTHMLRANRTTQTTECVVLLQLAKLYTRTYSCSMIYMWMNIISSAQCSNNDAVGGTMQLPKFLPMCCAELNKVHTFPVHADRYTTDVVVGGEKWGGPNDMRFELLLLE